MLYDLNVSHCVIGVTFCVGCLIVYNSCLCSVSAFDNVIMEPVKLSKVKDIDMSRNETRDKKTCIIILCNIADDLVVTTENGRSKIIAAPSIRKDSVSDRLSCLTPDSIFYYHVTNDCYKRFCHTRSLDRCQEIAAASAITEEHCNVNAPKDSRKSLRKCARRSSPQSSQRN